MFPEYASDARQAFTGPNSASYGKISEAASSRMSRPPSGMKKTDGKGLVVAFLDGYGDGRMSFFIGNDGTPAGLDAQPRQACASSNAGAASGLAARAPGPHMAAMGADWADYDRDGRMYLTVIRLRATNRTASSTAVGHGLFEQRPTRWAYPGRRTSRWDSARSGSTWTTTAGPDIVSSRNGHVYDRTHDVDPIDNLFPRAAHALSQSSRGSS